MINAKTITALIFACLFVRCGPGHSKNVSNGDAQLVASKHADSNSAKPKTFAMPHPESLSADDVISLLKKGNRNFVSKLSSANIAHDSSYNYFDQIAVTRNEQHPIACILTCMDSRVPPEIIFDQGIGALFVVRIAGNIEDPDVLGSMEYAVAEKGVKVIVVLGHKNCGAIHACFDKLDPENKQLVSLVAQVKKDVIANDQPPYDASARHNVKLTIDHILNFSTTIREKMLARNLILVGALYDVTNGTIDWNSSNW